MKRWLCAFLLTLTMGIGHVDAHNEGGEDSYSHRRDTHVTTTTFRHAHKHHVSHHANARRGVLVLSKDDPELVNIPTAAGISIRVNRKVAGNFQGFIKDLVDAGYKPRHIGCWAPNGTHVSNSNHYHGGACDFDQTGWNATAPRMYHVRDLAAKWGLRDGCSFRRSDCGHIDDGNNIHWAHPNLITRFIDWTLQPIKAIVQPFEE